LRELIRRSFKRGLFTVERTDELGMMIDFNEKEKRLLNKKVDGVIRYV